MLFVSYIFDDLFVSFIVGLFVCADLIEELGSAKILNF